MLMREVLTMLYAYLRPPNQPLSFAETTKGQATTILEFCDRNNLSVGEWFVDAPSAAATTWFKRPEGRRLTDKLAQGDSVVIAAGQWVYSTADDLHTTIEWLRARDAVLCFAGANEFTRHNHRAFSTAGHAGEVMVAVLRILVALKFSRRSETARVGVATRKARGVRHCRYPGYGFVWKGQKGHQVRVPHAGEQAAITRIIERRNAGASWNRIARELLWDRVTTSDGEDWSPSRVRRAFLSEASRTAAADLVAKRTQTDNHS
jgi:Resolvase, N terminal domain